MIAHRLTYGQVAAIAVLFIAGTIVAGCVTTQNSMPTARQLVDMGSIEPDADLETLHQGRALAITACLDCHRVYFPQEYHPARWPVIAREMGELSNLQPGEIRALRVYMVAASKTAQTENDE